MTTALVDDGQTISVKGGTVASGDVTVRAAIAGRKIIVTGWNLVLTGAAASLDILLGARVLATTKVLTGTLGFPWEGPDDCELTGAAAEALILSTGSTASTQVDGTMTYRTVIA